MPSKNTSLNNVKQALEQGFQVLSKANISSAWLDVEIILATVLHKERSFVVAHPEYILTKSQLEKFQALIKRRKNHEPIAYLTGKKEFYGLKFTVTQDTLVPRPESELIIDEAKKIIKPKSKTLIIDIGTGSGCLIISLLHELCKHNIKPQGIALDISKKALLIAKKNAKKHNIKNITFLQSNLLSTILKKPSIIKKTDNIVILANLPYLTPKEIHDEKSIHQEPRLALDGGQDGLDLYRKLVKQINIIKESNKSEISVICEINPHQKKGLQKAFNQKIHFVKDLSKRVRLGIVKYK